MILGLLGATAIAVAPPQMSLVASPARVQVEGTGHQTIRLSNHGRSAVVVDASRAGFALSLRGGRPRVVAAPGTARWLSFAPRRLRVAPGATTSITITTRVPRGTTPGDHASVLLLSTRPRARAGLAVRLRLGVVVVLRVPGRLVRRLQPSGLVVRHKRGTRTLVLALANRGNVTETLAPGRLTITLWKGRRRIARFLPPPRELLPHTRALFDLRYRKKARGVMRALVQLRPAGVGTAILRRSYRIRL